MLNIIVTGGDGRFAQELKKIKSRYNFIFRNKKQLNILSIKSIKYNFKKYKPDIILHLAGLSRPMDIHEKMISSSDSVNTFEFKDHYKILPSMYNWSVPQKVHVGKKVKKNFEYASNTNTKWMEVSELRNWIKKNQSFFESFYN